jgi:hypothetical protein|nr:MAG TPA: hypothetical protein [Caudoviricetes sp.]
MDLRDLFKNICFIKSYLYLSEVFVTEWISAIYTCVYVLIRLINLRTIRYK